MKQENNRLLILLILILLLFDTIGAHLYSKITMLIIIIILINNLETNIPPTYNNINEEIEL